MVVDKLKENGRIHPRDGRDGSHCLGGAELFKHLHGQCQDVGQVGRGRVSDQDLVFFPLSGTCLQVSLDPDPVFKIFWIWIKAKKCAESTLKVIFFLGGGEIKIVTDIP